ncbi:MAG TPA: hypothetical protein VM818_16415 [Vicinamibacterales bacterium]|jgi:hypothetical protein|nr:hypothetical protein [Vicinamibacterales bacterium]
MYRIARARFLPLLGVLGLPSLLYTQTVKPTDEMLADYLRVGRLISDTDTNGETIRGRVAAVSGDSLLVHGLEEERSPNEWRFSLASPAAVTLTKDPLWDGTAIGLLFSVE